MTGVKGMKGAGGFRKNARRPLKYGEPTKMIQFRVPMSKADEVKKKVQDMLKRWEVKKADKRTER